MVYIKELDFTPKINAIIYAFKVYLLGWMFISKAAKILLAAI